MPKGEVKDMINYLITYTYGEKLFGCSTYLADTLREAKEKFRAEFAEEKVYIVQIQIIERIKKIA